jgi:hypothetical protein
MTAGVNGGKPRLVRISGLLSTTAGRSLWPARGGTTSSITRINHIQPKTSVKDGTQGIASQIGPTSTVLGNSCRSISDAMGVSFSRGMASVFLAFKRRMQDRVDARF